MKILPDTSLKNRVDCRKAPRQEFLAVLAFMGAGVFNKRGAKYLLIFSDPRRRLMDSGLPPGGSGMTTR